MYDRIIVGLAVSDIRDGNRGSGFHERAAEESFVIPAVRDEVQRRRDRPGRLSPSRFDSECEKGGTKM